MKRIGALLLAVAVGASLPAMAMAQRGPDDQDRHGNQREDRGPNRGGEARRGPDAAQPQQAQQAPQEINRERVAGAQQTQRDDRRGDGNRANDGRHNDDHRFDNDRRPGNDGRFVDNRRLNDNRQFNDGRFNNGRPGDNRWVGGNWRQDRRYDWRGYRDANRGQFRIGRYNAPRGWSYGYRRFSIGAVLPGLLWGPGYWLDDPYAYRLPPAYGPYRWVRYYDDVLLIDVRSGRVVDAIPGFFW